MHENRETSEIVLSLPTDRIDGGVPLLVRFKTDPNAMLVQLGNQLHAVDPNLVVYGNSFESLLTSTPTFVLTRLSAIFAPITGGLGLVLACVGICGTVSYAVRIRTALGARTGDVVRMNVFERGRPVMLG